MSYTTLNQAASDGNLQNRVTAAVQKEARMNPTLGQSDFGLHVIDGSAYIPAVMMWPVAVDTEAVYEYAINSSNPDPGGDPTVITDEMILSAVQIHWPPDPWPLVIPPAMLKSET